MIVLTFASGEPVPGRKERSFAKLLNDDRMDNDDSDDDGPDREFNVCN